MENKIEYCKYCGCEISTTARFCCKCGKETGHNEIFVKNYKLTKCKACGAMVSKSAKACPNCGEKTTGQLLGEAIGGIGCGLIAAPFIMILIFFYVIVFDVLK